jgi:hypothetical protein
MASRLRVVSSSRVAASESAARKYTNQVLSDKRSRFSPCLREAEEFIRSVILSLGD